jgi:hypothetical protein
MKRMRRNCARLCLLLLIIGLGGTALPVFGQNWITDARRIGMGGVGGSENLASQMIESPDGAHTTIVVPLALFQILKDLDVYNPSSDNFDPIRATENVVAPFHYTFNRNGTGTGADFINDLLDGRLNRDLNTYRGFIPTTQPVAYGLWTPNWGATIPFYKKGKTRQSIYIGGGAYLPFRGSILVDDQLKTILSSDTNVYIPNAQFNITGAVRVELPVAVTVGYRGRFQVRSGGSDRDGLYVSFNYNYLRGFAYEDTLTNLRMDTDSRGLLTFNPTAPFNPIEVVRVYSSKGHGLATDVGASWVVHRIEVGFGINGLANRINWTGVKTVRYSLTNILTGTGDFVTSPTTAAADVRVEQPIEYVGSGGYHANHWQATGEIGKRTSSYAPDTGHLGSTWIHTGFEYRFGLLEPRAGAFFSRSRWIPAAGLGLNFGKFGIDVAAFSNDSNVERYRHPSIALSLRFGNLHPDSGISSPKGSTGTP